MSTVFIVLQTEKLAKLMILVQKVPYAVNKTLTFWQSCCFYCYSGGLHNSKTTPEVQTETQIHQVTVFPKPTLQLHSTLTR